MSRKLIIRLKNTVSDTLEFDWTYLNNNGRPQFFKSEEFNGILQKTDQIVVLVPGEDVLITEVKLPKLSAHQLAKALPYALEDQLAEDPETLHFAAGVAHKGFPVPVAVVARNKMTHWIEFLKEQLKTGFSKVKALIPDTLAIPYKDKTFHVLVNDELALVRTQPRAGFAIEKDNLFSIFDLMFKRENQIKPDKIIMSSDSRLFSDEQQAKLAIPIEIHNPPENPLILFAETANEPYPINLLQGLFATKQKALSFDQIIKATAVVASALVFLLFIEDIISYLILARVQHKITTEAKLIYQSVYPNAAIPADPRMSMQKDLSQLRAIHADTIFIRLVNLIEPIVRQLIQQGLILKEANFRNNQLTLSIESKDSSLVENLQQSLDALGLKTTVKGAQRETSGLIETHLTIEEMI